MAEAITLMGTWERVVQCALSGENLGYQATIDGVVVSAITSSGTLKSGLLTPTEARALGRKVDAALRSAAREVERLREGGGG